MGFEQEAILERGDAVARTRSRAVDLLKIDIGLWIFGSSLGREGNARAADS